MDSPEKQLARRPKMIPRPDHGERSYKGSGRLNYLPVEEPDAREVIELIRREGRKAIALPGDIRDEAFCRKLVGDTVGQLGGLDILVNNAARQVAKPSILDTAPNT